MAKETCGLYLIDLKAEHFIGAVTLTVTPSLAHPNVCKQRQTVRQRHCYCLSIRQFGIPNGHFKKGGCKKSGINNSLATTDNDYFSKKALLDMTYQFQNLSGKN